MPTVLVIDDNPSVATALDVLFSLRDLRTLTAESPEAGLAMLASERIDLVVQDMNFSADTTSGEEGIALFKAIRARHPDMPVVLLTAWTHLEQAVDLVKAGAADYLAKPWDDNKLLTTVENLLELGQATRELRSLRTGAQRAADALRERYDLRGMVFGSALTERCIALACQVARSDVPVLITGPNGAGKECIATIVQANSSVAKGPFVTVNCGAIPGELIEAELFGAEAGAYTGAQKSREGKFEAADGGTLFLDEIGNLPLSGQIKLLRVLETGRFERLGSNREKQVKVRLISATNADLKGMIANGSFREDLYYRLNLIEINLPPLRQRREDILPLAEHFLAGEARLGAAAREALLAHDWPGNVRELKNAVRRALLLRQSDTLEPSDLGLSASVTRSTTSEEEPDRETIERALALAGGVIAQAAQELGLSRQALYRRMDKLGIGR